MPVPHATLVLHGLGLQVMLYCSKAAVSGLRVSQGIDEMLRYCAVLGIVLLSPLATERMASAQLFGERTLGRSLSRQSNPDQSGRPSSQTRPTMTQGSRVNRTTLASGAERPSFESVGAMVDENARFVRGNRAANDFVGSDLAEAQNFVGMQQTDIEADIRSAVDEQLIEEAPEVNLGTQPAIPPRMLLNPPRLQVGFDYTPRAADVVSSQLTRRIGSKLSSDASNRIEVWVEDGVAILRGEVVTERDRKLAEILVGFEPGVARVQNEIQLAAAARASAEQPMLPPPPVPRP